MDKKMIKRSVFIDLKDHLSQKEISLIVGPRQVGKTTLMLLLKEYLELRGDKTLFLSMDFEDNAKFFSSQENLLKKLQLEFGNNKGYVFLDEIQKKENAGLFLKGVYDKNLPYKFIVSGSGSVELKEKVHESLAGRKLLFEVSPISFFEFVNFKTDYRYENKLNDFCSLEIEKVFGFLEDYMNFGGYPKVILSETMQEKTRTIDEIYRSYIEKDISYLMRVEKLDAFGSLIKILASQTGNILNYSELANTLDISLPTVKNYIWYLEKTFIIKKVTPFFRNARKEITKSPVVYFYDLGLRNYLMGNLGRVGETKEFGFLFQNFIFNSLNKIFKFSGAKINFWRTKEKAEVDFVASIGNKIVPIEVKYKEFKEPSIERSMRSFIKKYHPLTALVINKNLEENIAIDKTKIIFLPFWKARPKIFETYIGK